MQPLLDVTIVRPRRRGTAVVGPPNAVVGLATAVVGPPTAAVPQPDASAPMGDVRLHPVPVDDL
jgi:hypothetical protein